MNWLTHILLSKKNIEYQLGNFLADPLKGHLWEGASQSLYHGVKMHQSIDAFTDAHPQVSKSKARLGEKGYLKGVVIDLLYDHYLAANWAQYSSVKQSDFLTQFYTQATRYSQRYPQDVQTIVYKLVQSESLSNYKEFDGFINALKRIDKRLSPRIRAKESALDYIPLVEKEYLHLQKDFMIFFPELIRFFANHELGSNHNNYLLTRLTH